jgi:arsenate reductase
MAREAVRIEVLAFEGCPHAEAATQLAQAKTSTGALCCRSYGGGVGIPPEWLVEAAALRALSPWGVLFLCVANSARSQMAEGIARSLAPPGMKIWSAGSRPSRVRPEAVAALAEIGIDISQHRSKAVSEIPAGEVDTVITLCGEEECPVFLGHARRVHWGLPAPAAFAGSDADRLDAFRRTRDERRRRLGALFAHDEPEGVRS